MAIHRSRVYSAFAVLAVVMFLAVTVLPVLSATPDEEEVPVEAPEAQQQESGPAWVNTPYYVNAQSGAAVLQGGLSPAALQMNETLAEIQAPGPTFPRRTLTRVGVFSMQVSMGMPLQVQSITSMNVWAKGNEPVANARFRFLFLKNGNREVERYTNTMNMETSPMEFTVPDPPSFSNPMTFRRGDTMGIEIQYTASSRYFVGPAPSCVVLANTIAQATRIELMCKPLEMNVSMPSIQEGLLHIPGRVVDTSDIDPQTELYVSLGIFGGTTAVHDEHVKRMRFDIGDTEILVNWTWDFRACGATDGLWEFRIDVSYGVIGINYTNSTFVELEFPREKKKSAFLNRTSITGIVIVAVIAIAAGAVVMRRRRASMYAAAYYGPGPPPPGMGVPPPKVKRAKRADRKAKRSKRGKPPRGAPPPSMPPRGPPPKGPPPRGRAPMPGRAPPDARGPPRGPPGTARPPPREGRRPR